MFFWYVDTVQISISETFHSPFSISQIWRWVSSLGEEKRKERKICRKAGQGEKVVYSLGSSGLSFLWERAAKRFRECHPLWPIDYFELKALEKQQVPGGLSALSLSPWKQDMKFPTGKVCSLGQEEKRLGVDAEMNRYKQTCWNNPDLPWVSPYVS